MQIQRLLPLMLLLAGCAYFSPHYQLTPTGKPSVGKPPTCEFTVGASYPGPGYEEIGILEPAPAGAGNAEAFKESVRAQVCSIGGDHVVGQINGIGTYMRGVVLKKVDAAK